MRGMAVPTTEVFKAISIKARAMPSMAARDSRKLRSDGGGGMLWGFKREWAG